MATVKVTRNGKPMQGIEVSTESTFGFYEYDRSKTTDSNGEAEFPDNENRFRIYAAGSCVDTVAKLRGTIRVEL